MEYVTLSCRQCTKSYPKQKSTALRNESRGRKTFCSKRCSALHSNLNPSPKRKEWLEKLSKPGGLPYLSRYVIAGHCANRLDEFSPFRPFLHSVMRRVRSGRKTGDVTLVDLKYQWDKQDGKCPITGVAMMRNPNCGRRLKRSPFGASIDRKDSSLGYHKDNIQFVCLMANLAKNVFTEEQLLNFCHSVAMHKPKK